MMHSGCSRDRCRGKEGSHDLILCGKEAIDYNGGVFGGLLAEMLSMPYEAWHPKLDLQGKILCCLNVKSKVKRK